MAAASLRSESFVLTLKDASIAYQELVKKSDITKQGWMRKKGGGLYGWLDRRGFPRFCRWSQTMVVLRRGHVYCYSTVTSEKPFCIFCLFGYDQIEQLHAQGDKVWIFQLVPLQASMVTYCFAADNKDVLDDWMKAFADERDWVDKEYMNKERPRYKRLPRSIYGDTNAIMKRRSQSCPDLQQPADDSDENSDYEEIDSDLDPDEAVKPKRTRKKVAKFFNRLGTAIRSKMGRGQTLPGTQSASSPSSPSAGGGGGGGGALTADRPPNPKPQPEKAPRRVPPPVPADNDTHPPSRVPTAIVQPSRKAPKPAVKPKPRKNADFMSTVMWEGAANDGDFQLSKIAVTGTFLVRKGKETSPPARFPSRTLVVYDSSNDPPYRRYKIQVQDNEDQRGAFQYFLHNDDMFNSIEALIMHYQQYDLPTVALTLGKPYTAFTKK